MVAHGVIAILTAIGGAIATGITFITTRARIMVEFLIKRFELLVDHMMRMSRYLATRAWREPELVFASITFIRSLWG